jgi:predicted HD phosphohydrolase
LLTVFNFWAEMGKKVLATKNAQRADIIWWIRIVIKKDKVYCSKPHNYFSQLSQFTNVIDWFSKNTPISKNQLTFSFQPFSFGIL